MAFIKCLLKSEVLHASVNVNLYFPCDSAINAGKEIAGVITLLHGFSNCGDDWIQMSAAARYAADNNLALVVPDAANSFYNNMAYGGAYFTYFTEELPALLNKMFRLPMEREKNFIAGLSMGGYGALLLGLSQPHRYAAAASFSGAVEVGMMLADKENPLVRGTFVPVFGEELLLPPERDLNELARRVALLPENERPRILCTCGNEDMEPYMIKPQNDFFASVMQDLPLAFSYQCWTGVHEWNFWDRSLVVAIDFFLHNGYAEKKLNDWRTD